MSTKTLVIDRPATQTHDFQSLDVGRAKDEHVAAVADSAEQAAATEDSVCFDVLTEADLVHGHWHQSLEYGGSGWRYILCESWHSHIDQGSLLRWHPDVVRLVSGFSGIDARHHLSEAAKHDCFAAVVAKLISEYRASRPVTFNAQVSEKEASVVAIHPQTGRIAYCFDSSSREMPELYRSQGYQRINFKSFRALERFCRGQGTVNDVETDCRDGLEQDYNDAKRRHNAHIDASVAQVKRMREELARRPDHAALQRELRNFTIHHFGELTSDRHSSDR